MPRLARKIQEGHIYHIMTKGINHERIFDKIQFKERILSLYGYKLYNWQIYAYAIMNNHTHFLVEVPTVDDLSEIMKSINIKYSRFYNQINNRNGHLFQNRFKSVEIKSEQQLFETLRYIHNNPVFAGLSKDISTYKFTSYRKFFNKIENNIIDEKFILETRDNFKDEENFKDFHNERLFSLQMDTRDDQELAKEYMIKYISDKIEDKDKIAYAKKLVEYGFSKRYLAKKLSISRRSI